jgi:hypothetical protein
MSLLFRWSVWGDKRRMSEMLPYSVGTFRRAFGPEARYVVGTDEPAEIRPLFGEEVEVIGHDAFGRSPFDIDSKPTWRKWCPAPRIAPACTEFYVDADVFLVGDPSELRAFHANRAGTGYLVMQEPPGARYWVGRFGPRILKGLPPVNTGFLGQRVGTDITSELTGELEWWLEHVPADRHLFHDDQGAVITVLARSHLIGQVKLLPHDTYRIVNDRANAHLQNLEGIAVIHATKGHTAFQRFHDEVARAASL